MVGFAEEKAELDKLGVSVVAASIDTGDESKEVADEVNFPVGEGVTREIADALGSWWEDRRSIIQPSEFIIRKDGSVACSTYSSGPIGRMEPEDAVKLIKLYASRE